MPITYQQYFNLRNNIVPALANYQAINGNGALQAPVLFGNGANAYSSLGSWAIWDQAQLRNLNIFPGTLPNGVGMAANVPNLKSSVVVLGLNPGNAGAPPVTWANFHSGRTDHWYRTYFEYQAGNATQVLAGAPSPGLIFRGAYMTDTIKTIHGGNSAQVVNVLTPAILQQNAKILFYELNAFGFFNSISRLIICIGQDSYNILADQAGAFRQTLDPLIQNAGGTELDFNAEVDWVYNGNAPVATPRRMDRVKIVANRWAVIGDLQTLAREAQNYYAKPTSLGGGGTFIALTADSTGIARLGSKSFSDNVNGVYVIQKAGTADTIVFRGTGRVRMQDGKVPTYEIIVTPDKADLKKIH